jgi:hypothetical protein
LVSRREGEDVLKVLDRVSRWSKSEFVSATYFCPAISVVGTEYPNGNRLLASLYTRNDVVNYASQALLDGIHGEERLVLIIDLDSVRPIVDHHEYFASVG